MRLLIPLLLSLALPVMAAPKYKIQVSNQLGGWQQYQTVHHRPSASRTAQHRPKQLNQASNSGSLMRMETPWTSSIPGQGSWVGSSALLIPSLLNTSCTEAVSMWKGSQRTNSELLFHYFVIQTQYQSSYLLVNDYPLSLSINDFMVIYNLIILIKN